MDTIRPFPVDSPIRPEERLIGRTRLIDDLTRQIADRLEHTLLFAPRRVGKTSLALASLDRIRADDRGWAIEVDLRHGPIAGPSDLADRLAAQARAAGVKARTARDRGGRWRKIFARGVGPARQAARVLELEDAAALAAAVDQMLGPVETEKGSDLREVLNALEAAAVASDRFIAALIDEIHLIASWPEAEYAVNAIGETMERPNGRVILLFAGSETSAVEGLFHPGSRLHYDGIRFDIPEISEDDWVPALRQRFSEVEIEIDPAEIRRILEESGGHPQRTMRICAHVHRWCQDARAQRADATIVDNAMDDARKHPSWNSDI